MLKTAILIGCLGSSFVMKTSESFINISSKYTRVFHLLGWFSRAVARIRQGITVIEGRFCILTPNSCTK